MAKVKRSVSPVTAARRLGVHERTVRRWIERDQIPGAWVTPGGRHMIPRESLDALLGRKARAFPGKPGQSDN